MTENSNTENINSIDTSSSSTSSNSLEQQRIELERERLKLEQMRLSQSQYTPVINIVNTATSAPVTNQSVNSPSQHVEPQKNTVAMVIGITAAIFGFFGVAHIVNGRFLSGIGHMVVGWLWITLMSFLIGITAGVGAFILVPLHIYFIIRNANRGAMRRIG